MRKIIQKRILLCEGISDLAFLSLYIERKYGFKYKEDVFFLTDKNQHASSYSNGEAELYICSVGGKTRFKEFFSKHILNIINASENDVKVAIFTDNDIDFDIDLLVPSEIHFALNKWSIIKLQNDFDEPINCQTILKVIPTSKSGALESLIIDSEKSRDYELAESVNKYVDSISSDLKKRYKIIKRKELKIKVSIIMSVIDPERTFSNISKRFDSLKLDNDVINENMSFLSDLLN